jgi:hypothetical protein
MALIRATTYLQRAVNQLFIPSFMSKSRGTIALFQIVDNSIKLLQTARVYINLIFHKDNRF